MTKIRPEALVEIWAKRPDVFELEPIHVRAQFAAQVEAKIKELERAAQKAAEKVAKAKIAAKKKTPAKKAGTKGD